MAILPRWMVPIHFLILQRCVWEPTFQKCTFFGYNDLFDIAAYHLANKQVGIVELIQVVQFPSLFFHGLLPQSSTECKLKMVKLFLTKV